MWGGFDNIWGRFGGFGGLFLYALGCLHLQVLRHEIPINTSVSEPEERWACRHTNKKFVLKHGIYLFLFARAEVTAILFPVHQGRYVRTQCNTFKNLRTLCIQGSRITEKEKLYLSVLLSSATAGKPKSWQ